MGEDICYEENSMETDGFLMLREFEMNFIRSFHVECLLTEFWIRELSCHKHVVRSNFFNVRSGIITYLRPLNSGNYGVKYSVHCASLTVKFNALDYAQNEA
jgi:hypothetical protein